MRRSQAAARSHHRSPSDRFGAHRAIALIGGLVGVTQRADGALQPIAGWHVEPA
jgi:hypothetical protein